MPRFRIASETYDLEPETVEAGVSGVLPEPIHQHYVVIAGRRYPPKQALTCATGLDRADFTTHQARRILKRLGFTAARRGAAATESPPGRGPHGGRQAEALRPFVGKWVALAGPTDVLVAAETPHEVLAWLAHHEQRAPYGMFRVPRGSVEAQGTAPL